MSATTLIPKIDIRPDHWAIVRGILQKHVPQYAVWAFGSRAKWTAKEYSDLDLAIITDQPLSLDISASLTDEFSESDLPWKVDVVDWASTSASFRQVIERDKVVVQEGGRGWAMGSDWKTYTLGELGQIKTGKTPPSSLGDGFGGTVPFVTPGDMKGQKWITETDRKLNEIGLSAVRSSLVPARSVAVSCIGSDMGKAALLVRSSVTNQQINTIAVDESRFNAEFIYYDLSARQQELKAAASGSATPILNKGHFSAFEILVPPRATQDKIAEVLGRLDDKIDLNRRINQTLEAMAQAIFKSWFVDFDPVKAKIAAIAQGQDPLRAAMHTISGKTDLELDQMPREHHDQLAATAALLPDEMQESELGEIPKGWEVGTFKQCCLRVESGGTPSRKEPVFWGGSIPWLTSGEVRDVVVLDTKEKITPDGLDSSSAKLWPLMTTVVAMYGATAGQVCLLAKEMTANQACCALIPLAEFKAFIFIAARQSIQQLSEKASGSAQQNLNKSLVENHAYVIPTKNIAEKFEKATTALLQRWIQNQKETATLGMVRDTLLPKLLSGELRVPDTEFIAEEMWP